ncbi:Metallo-hydrolase [Phialemonium atrogriseum]|uniref:Metallo-hydrolase n=1 Tax=Phialemonium atrogriseum TaxID=1093897 RepID=A0AAJ0BS55_9PEZI|nr:Metallo-hydrolase [Phialemonium atrogriseum]KAK1763270.1 Metallo-hydrolase [Phialemonium atrogriseum]
MTLPPCRPGQNFVSVSPIDGGSITLPERCFVAPSDPDASSTVPSMAFLITHPGLKKTGSDQHASSKPGTRIMFDLGLRSHLGRYIPAAQQHLNQGRTPYRLGPGVAAHLAAGGLCAASDIDMVILSHVHYDHHGDPEDYGASLFIVGKGSLDLLERGVPTVASHQNFDPKLLSGRRTVELTSPYRGDVEFRIEDGTRFKSSWAPLGPFPAALDIFSDGSVFVIDAPGHLTGHLNLLCRTGADTWVYLGGDTCHDMRLLTGEREIGTWDDGHGHCICIHLDKAAAELSIQRVRDLLSLGDRTNASVDVVMAHDHEWHDRNKERFYPNCL